LKDGAKHCHLPFRCQVVAMLFSSYFAAAG